MIYEKIAKFYSKKIKNNLERLLDYADIICSKLVSASDFKRQIEYKLAKFGALEENRDEHDLRQR